MKRRLTELGSVAAARNAPFPRVPSDPGLPLRAGISAQGNRGRPVADRINKMAGGPSSVINDCREFGSSWEVGNVGKLLYKLVNFFCHENSSKVLETMRNEIVQ